MDRSTKRLPADVTERVTRKAFEVGYRHVDSAKAYHNEAPCGQAIRNSGLKRSEIFFTTKVPPKEMGYDKAKAAIEASLENSQIDYIDLLLIHAPFGGKGARQGSWRAVVEAQRAGKVRSIGISNYGVHHLEELEEYMKSGIGGTIDVGQYELHPWLPRRDIVDWLQKRGVVMEAYSPIVRGQRSEDPTLLKLGEKYGKTPAQILLRWSLQKGFVPLPKSTQDHRIEENGNVFDFELTPEEMESLNTNDYSPCAWDPTVSNE
ncbi:hypothetical protein FQN54_000271 [Arachnomyces sp. PD_36]|nr:hypothetical protein FQN54_000271 [Arachnomyces sp. PD_36]